MTRYPMWLILASSLLMGCPFTSCFVRGTRVATPRGPRKIEELEQGDEVFSWSLTERRIVVRRIAAVLRNTATRTLRVTAGEQVIAGVTLEHPFFDATHGDFRPVGDLTARSRLVVWAGAGDVVERPLSSLSVVESQAPVDVFNLSVAGDEQNYFAEGILVHNKSPIAEDGDGDGFNSDSDCNDQDAAINPEAGEICDDGVDNDCDGTADIDDFTDCSTTTASGGTGGSSGATGSGASGGSSGATGSGASGGSGGATGGSGGATGGSGGSGGG